MSCSVGRPTPPDGEWRKVRCAVITGNHGTGSGPSRRIARGLGRITPVGSSCQCRPPDEHRPLRAAPVLRRHRQPASHTSPSRSTSGFPPRASVAVSPRPSDNGGVAVSPLVANRNAGSSRNRRSRSSSMRRLIQRSTPLALNRLVEPKQGVHYLHLGVARTW